MSRGIRQQTRLWNSSIARGGGIGSAGVATQHVSGILGVITGNDGNMVSGRGRLHGALPHMQYLPHCLPLWLCYFSGTLGAANHSSDHFLDGNQTVLAAVDRSLPASFSSKLFFCVKERLLYTSYVWEEGWRGAGDSSEPLLPRSGTNWMQAQC